MGTTTPNRGLYKPDAGPPGETGWGDLVNANFDILDSAAATDLSDLLVNAADYGIVSGGSASTNAEAFQDALDAGAAGASNGGGYVWIPAGIYSFDTTLTIAGGVHLAGSGIGVGGPQLRYTGADGTNAIEDGSGETSNTRISGLRLEDYRTTPTSGDGIHLSTTNGSVVEDVACFGFPGNGIYMGAASGTPDNYEIRDVWVGSKGGWGITLDHVSQNAILTNIKGDSPSTGMQALVRLMGNAGGGYSNPVIIGCKMEVGGSHSPAPDLIYIDSTFHGTLVAHGLHLGTTGGYLINNASTDLILHATGLGAVVNITGYLKDAASGKTYGLGTKSKYGAINFATQGVFSPVITNIGCQAESVRTISNSNVTLDGSYSTVLMSTGSSDRTVFLPAAASSLGYRYRIKKVDAGAGDVIITPASSSLLIAYRASASNSNSSATSSLAISVPAGTTDGDVMVAMLEVSDSGSNVINVPTGWTELDHATSVGPNTKIFWRVASNEPASYTWNFTVSNICAGAISSYSGAAGIINVTGTFNKLTSTTATATSITTTSNGCMLVFCAGVAHAETYTGPTGFTQRSVPSATGTSVIMADKIQSSAGATGDVSATLSTGSNNNAILIALVSQGAPLIDGATTNSISAAYAAVDCVCDGAAWNIVGSV